MKESDNKSLLRAMVDIATLKNKDHPVAKPIVELGGFGLVKLDQRSWDDVPEPAKLAMLEDLVNWEGVTNRDMAHLLLRELDVGKIPDADRNRLIAMADPGRGKDEKPKGQEGKAEQGKRRGRPPREM
jgi:hypothetical protein